MSVYKYVCTGNLSVLNTICKYVLIFMHFLPAWITLCASAWGAPLSSSQYSSHGANQRLEYGAAEEQ